MQNSSIDSSNVSFHVKDSKSNDIPLDAYPKQTSKSRGTNDVVVKDNAANIPLKVNECYGTTVNNATIPVGPNQSYGVTSTPLEDTLYTEIHESREPEYDYI